MGQGAAAGSITLQQLISVKDDTDMETMDKLAGYIGVKSATARNMTDDEQTAAADEANAAAEAAERPWPARRRPLRRASSARA